MSTLPLTADARGGQAQGNYVYSATPAQLGLAGTILGASGNTIISTANPLLSASYDVLSVPASGSPVIGVAATLPTINDTSSSAGWGALAQNVSTFGALDLRGLNRPTTGRDIGAYEAESTGVPQMRPLLRSEVGVVAATLPVYPIVKFVPTIIWPAPSAITSGTALSKTQLNANAGGIAGTFVFSPTLGTVLGIGDLQTLNVTFTPFDSALYNPASASTPITVARTGYLSNLSVRAAMTSDQTLIVGFVVDGGAKPMLVRAAGPALNAYGLTGVTDPRLNLFSGSTNVGSNNDWDSALASTFTTLGAFAFANGSQDAALLQSLNGAHTAQATATNAGAILVEAYDAGPNDARKLTNLSARFRVGTGDNILIAGFVVAGTGTRQVLVRAVGPKLADYGVTSVLADPQFTVYDGNTPLATNNDWDSALAPTFGTLGAFQLNTASKDAALLVTLQAGKSYTVQVSGVGATTGEALVEVYLVP